MKAKIFYAISLLIIMYCVFVLYDHNLLFKDARTDYGSMLQLYLPLLSVSFATIIYGIGCLLENKK